MSSTDTDCDDSGEADDTVSTGECDDDDSSVNPGVASDGANCVDDDCDGSVDEDASYTYTHDSDIQSIWTSTCATCHTSSSSGGLSLTSAYSKIVNVASSDVPTMDLVDDTCDTNDSYIWHKLKGTQASVGGAGSTMPKSGSISSSDLAKIQTWIEEGAPN